MKIKDIEIINFRGIDNAKFDLSDNLNVFVGVNGSGKTTILDAIATSLSWLVNRIQRENASGRPISESSIKNGVPFASIEITVEQDQDYKWKIYRAAKGFSINMKSELTKVSELAFYFQEILHKNSTIPVIAYYPINRVVDTIDSKISGKESLNILDVYENALGGKTNYQSFFEWFRIQDDIVNERAQSRTKWMIQNKAWTKRKVAKLLSYLESMDRENKLDFNDNIKRFREDEDIYKDPQFLFDELTHLLHIIEDTFFEPYFFKYFEDIGFLLRRIISLSDSRRDNLFEADKFLTSIIERIVKQIIDIQYRKDYNDDLKKMISFIWEALSFSVLVSFWWLSDKGKKELENLFLEYSPIKHKDSLKLQHENEKFTELIDKIVHNDAERLDKASRNEGQELKQVTKAIENFVSGYANLRLTRVPHPQMLVNKDGETISLNQLSDGEKNLIALVGDIARRLSIANSNSKKPLDGNGIILIDEIDLHLHPSWQRLMIPKLIELFPNCQFIITTHSPQVLSHVHSRNIFLLKNEKNVFSFSKAMESYGQNSDRILEDLLGVDARPRKEKEMLHNLFELIQKGELQKAKKVVEVLSKQIEGSDPEIVKAEVLIKRKEIIGK